MTVARITEISSTSPLSFEDAIRSGVARACETLRDVRGAWVKEQQIVVSNDEIVEFRVNLMVTFVLEAGPAAAGAAPRTRRATASRRTPARRRAR